MNLHQEDLLNMARASGFRAEMLEKVIRLVDVLNELFDNNFLKQRLVLKGGTALNLFYLDMPRLSIDIDLNYIGAIDRKVMLEERQELETILFELCQRAGLTIKRAATEHAGGKWRLTFTSVVQPSGNLEIDISYLYRVTLWPVVVQDSYKIGLYQARNIPILDIHELAAGKLAALMSRHASRDLYDTHQLANLLTNQKFDKDRLRLAFIVFGAMSRRDWRGLNIKDIDFNSNELINNLIPVLNQNDLPEANKTQWVEQLIGNCQKVLFYVLPFSEREQAFLDLLLEKGEFDPSLITNDLELQQKILNHPGLHWKAHNVRKFKKISYEYL